MGAGVAQISWQVGKDERSHRAPAHTSLGSALRTQKVALMCTLSNHHWLPPLDRDLGPDERSTKVTPPSFGASSDCFTQLQPCLFAFPAVGW